MLEDSLVSFDLFAVSNSSQVRDPPLLPASIAPPPPPPPLLFLLLLLLLLLLLPLRVPPLLTDYQPAASLDANS